MSLFNFATYVILLWSSCNIYEHHVISEFENCALSLPCTLALSAATKCRVAPLRGLALRPCEFDLWSSVFTFSNRAHQTSCERRLCSSRSKSWITQVSAGQPQRDVPRHMNSVALGCITAAARKTPCRSITQTLRDITDRNISKGDYD